MASWTDTNPVQFTPYVQQQPIEAMVAVGGERQRRYDEGVQRIQSSIDRIAGLDIVRDVDKQYLQNKLTDLGDKLKFVAAGDFSDYQLTNAVTGMTSKVGKDKNIQNAVISTARYRSELEKMEAAREEGKSAIQNEWDFGTKASNWLNDPNVGAAFNEHYTPYTDVNKKWFETFKSLHPIFREEDIAYNQIVKADGTIDYEAAAAMTRTSKEAISAAQIENAIRASLTPEELNQLSIDGRYRFRDLQPEMMEEYVKKNADANIKANNQKIEELQGLIGMSDSNPKRVVEAERIIKELQQKNRQITKNLSEEIQSIYDNPEQVKANIYKEEAINQFAGSFAWERNKTNILTSPIIQQDNWVREHSIRLAQLKLSQDKFAWDKFRDKFDMDLKMKEFMTSMGGTPGITSTLPLDTDLTKGEAPPIIKLMNEMSDGRAEIDKEIRNIAKKTGASETQVRNAIDRYLNNDEVWDKEGIIPIQFHGRVEEIRKKERGLRIKQQLYDDVVGDKPSQFVRMREEIHGIAEGFNPVTVRTEGGNIIYTPQELADYIFKSRMGYDFSEKEKVLKRLSNTPGHKYMSMTDLTTYSELYRQISKFTKDIKEDTDEQLNIDLAEKDPRYLPRLTDITFADDKGGIARNRWEDYALHALSPFNKDLASMKGGSSEISKSQIKTAREWLTGTSDKGQVHYKKFSYGDSKYLVLEKGTETIKIPLTPELASQMPLQDPNEMSSEYQKVFSTQFAFEGTTNPTGKYADSYFGKYDMPSIEELDVRADFDWDENDNTAQYVTLRLNTPIGVIPLQIKKPMPREAAMREFLQQLTDEQVKQIYLRDNRIPEDWKEVIKNL